MENIGNDQSRRSVERELSLQQRPEQICNGLEEASEETKTKTKMTTKTTATRRRLLSPSSVAAWLLLALCMCASMRTTTASDDDAAGDDAFANNYYANQGDDGNNIDDGNFYYNNGNGNYNRYYNYNYNNQGYNNQNYNGNYNNDDANNGNYNNNNDDANNNNGNGNGNNNNDDANGDGNNNNDDANGDGNNDDANNNNNDDANNNNNDDANDDANGNGNDDGYAYAYEAAAAEQWMDDNFSLDVDGFDGVSISPVSCVNYNNGHMIKFEIYETSNSYQCHFAQLGTFVVSVAHYMRAYFNYQALTQGSSFTLPDDVGYLNCIPLKMEKYGFEIVYDDDANANADGEDANRRRVEEAQSEDEDEDQKEQAILYAKLGCLSKETFSSNAFQLHVYTDDKCTEAYDDGQTEQEHASHGYNINLDEYYAANLDEDDNAVQYTDYPVNTLEFSTKVSFRPSFYSCHSCKPKKISNTFNKLSGTYYDDDFISQYGMTRTVYSAYLAEQQAQEQAAQCDDCQYYTYSTDDAADDYTVTQVVDDAYYSAYEDDYNFKNNDDGGNGRQLRLPATANQQQEKKQSVLVPEDKEFEKYELGFWKDINAQLNNRDRSLYEDSYGGVDDWNMCDQVYKYGLYCDEECQSLDSFRTNQWSGADIILLGIMCTFIASMMLLIVAKHQRSSMKILKAHSFYSENDYDPDGSGLDTKQIPGLPPVAMLSIFGAIMVTIVALAVLLFVNETLVFAVVCCILLFIYMLKITLFSVPKRPVLLASPNHEDIFKYNNAGFGLRKGGFFS